jgi:hypothetical protein
MHFYINKSTNSIYYKETYGDLEYDELSTQFYIKILNLYTFTYGFDFAYHLVKHKIIIPTEFIHNPNTQNIIDNYFNNNPEKKQYIIDKLDQLYIIANELIQTSQINNKLIDTEQVNIDISLS